MSLRAIEPTARAESEADAIAASCSLTAGDLMSTPVQTIDADATLAQAWSAMVEGGHRHLIVCSQGVCCGVVDDRTLFARWPTGPFGSEPALVRELLSARTSCVLPPTSAATVASIMATEGCDAVPVTDADGRVVGVVTSSDLAAAVAQHGLTRRHAPERFRA